MENLELKRENQETSKRIKQKNSINTGRSITNFRERKNKGICLLIYDQKLKINFHVALQKFRFLNHLMIPAINFVNLHRKLSFH